MGPCNLICRNTLEILQMVAVVWCRRRRGRAKDGGLGAAPPGIHPRRVATLCDQDATSEQHLVSEGLMLPQLSFLFGSMINTAF